VKFLLIWHNPAGGKESAQSHKTHKDVELPMLLPGIRLNTSAADSASTEPF
jgi:hypothetical protein